MNILIINGSLGASQGNTIHLIAKAFSFLEKSGASVRIMNLNERHPNIKESMEWAQGFLFASGTYWDSWGSPLQRFLEEITPYEGTELFLGKPAAVIISMHSVGGKSVLSRLQGVLNTFGILIPPMSGMAYSLSVQAALEHVEEFEADFWSPEDIEIIVHNLLTAAFNKTDYRSWKVDRSDPSRRWIK